MTTATLYSDHDDQGKLVIYYMCLILISLLGVADSVQAWKSGMRSPARCLNSCKNVLIVSLAYVGFIAGGVLLHRFALSRYTKITKETRPEDVLRVSESTPRPAVIKFDLTAGGFIQEQPRGSCNLPVAVKIDFLFDCDAVLGNCTKPVCCDNEDKYFRTSRMRCNCSEPPVDCEYVYRDKCRGYIFEMITGLWQSYGTEVSFVRDGPSAILYRSETFLFRNRTSETYVNAHFENLSREVLFSAAPCKGNTFCAFDSRVDIIEENRKSAFEKDPPVSQEGLHGWRYQETSGNQKETFARKHFNRVRGRCPGIMIGEDTPILWLPQREVLQFIYQRVQASFDDSLMNLAPSMILLISSTLILTLVCGNVWFWSPKEPERVSCEARGTSQDFVQDSFNRVDMHEGVKWFPSCVWTGYNEEGDRRVPYRLTLTFTESTPENTDRLSIEWHISGSGVDEIGSYVVTGEWSPVNLRVGFTMTYERDQNNGCIAVEYRGEAMRLPGQGIRGTWSLRKSKVSRDGYFHLWPLTVTAVSDEPVSLSSDRSNEFTHCLRSDPPKCVVCFVEDINAMLKPCGHVALCDLCAKAVLSQISTCPTCNLKSDAMEVVFCSQRFRMTRNSKAARGSSDLASLRHSPHIEMRGPSNDGSESSSEHRTPLMPHQSVAQR
eukprot:TRINITY_DN75413_c0_g1_i1.p1 TRINITY_DN75413_c0_g1~~TRINITY_DN75413_c0_g1_i1.p1  ORF type:complete len:699 (+),score=81.63 TRINITY_DN75413_c0_g1_i1:110-2098(+)